MDIIEKAREFAAEIQNTEIYNNLIDARKKSDEDSALQEMIGKFNLIKLNIDNEIAKEAASQDKLKEYNTELQNIYNDIMRNENMVAFNDAKSNADKLISKINSLMIAAINGEDVFSFDVDASCSGNCSSCGGCN